MAASKQNTEQMRAVSKLRVAADPQSLEAQNNFVFLSMLTRSAEAGLHERADALYRKAPQNPDVVATYALSLYQRGKLAEALRAMQTLTSEQLREPGTARYQGIFLTAAGRRADAAEYIALGAKGFVLPEEKMLLEHAPDDGMKMRLNQELAREPASVPR
jgi:Flp pilus assembly protein TadD